MQRKLKILILASALTLAAAGLFGPIYAVFVEQIGGNVATAGIAYGLFSISAGILIFFISKWEDRVKQLEKFVIFSYALSCVGFAGYLLVRKPLDLFIVQIILGLALAIGVPAYDGLYSAHLNPGKYASEWGAWESMYWIVTALAAFAGGFLVKLYGFKFLFTIMLVLSLLGFCVSFLLVVQ